MSVGIASGCVGRACGSVERSACGNVGGSACGSASGSVRRGCINHNLSKAVWQAGCNAALIAKDKSCSLSGYLSSQACR